MLMRLGESFVDHEGVGYDTGQVTHRDSTLVRRLLIDRRIKLGVRVRDTRVGIVASHGGYDESPSSNGELLLRVNIACQSRVWDEVSSGVGVLTLKYANTHYSMFVSSSYPWTSTCLLVL